MAVRGVRLVGRGTRVRVNYWDRNTDRGFGGGTINVRGRKGRGGSARYMIKGSLGEMGRRRESGRYVLMPRQCGKCRRVWERGRGID